MRTRYIVCLLLIGLFSVSATTVFTRTSRMMMDKSTKAQHKVNAQAKAKSNLQSMSTQQVLSLVQALNKELGPKGGEKGKGKDKGSGKGDGKGDGKVEPIIHDPCSCVEEDPCECTQSIVTYGPIGARAVEAEEADQDELPTNVNRVDSVPVTVVDGPSPPVGGIFALPHHLPSISDLAEHVQALAPPLPFFGPQGDDSHDDQSALDEKITSLEDSISQSHELQTELSDSLGKLVELLNERKQVIVEKTKAKAEEDIGTEKELLAQIESEMSSLETVSKRLKSSIAINEKIVSGEDEDGAAEEGAAEAPAA